MKLEATIEGLPAGTVELVAGALVVTDPRLSAAVMHAATTGPLWHPDGRDVALGQPTTRRQVEAALELANVNNSSAWRFKSLEPQPPDDPDLDVELVVY